MSITEIVDSIILEQMQDTADRICADYKRSVHSALKHPENSSGQAEGSIHVEQLSDWHYRIGSDHPHLYFFEIGNGTGGNPKNPPPRRPMPMTYGARGKPVRFAMRASNYAGQHVYKDVADRYR